MTFGIDLSNHSTISRASTAGVEVLLNETSERVNPSVVSFRGKEVLVGSRAISAQASNLQYTFDNILECLGNKIYQLADTVPAYQLMVEGDGLFYQTPDRIIDTTIPVSLLFRYLLGLQGNPSGSEVVVAIPASWAPDLRYKILSCLKMVGAVSRGFINQTTATALQCSIWTATRDSFESQNLMVIDSGHESTKVSIFNVQAGSMTATVHREDNSISGKVIDTMLERYCRRTVEERFSCSVDNRAKFKIKKACNKAKRILAQKGVRQTTITIEEVVPGRDHVMVLKQEMLDKIISSMPIDTLINRTIREAGIDTVNRCELVGGGSRIHSMKHLIVSTVQEMIPGLVVGSRVNAEESVSRGASLYCAIISPNLKVRDFKIEEVTGFEIWARLRQGRVKVIGLGERLPVTIQLPDSTISLVSRTGVLATNPNKIKGTVTLTRDGLIETNLKLVERCQENISTCYQEIVSDHEHYVENQRMINDAEEAMYRIKQLIAEAGQMFSSEEKETVVGSCKDIESAIHDPKHCIQNTANKLNSIYKKVMVRVENTKSLRVTLPKLMRLLEITKTSNNKEILCLYKDTKSWYREKASCQLKLADYQDPILLSMEVETRTRALEELITKTLDKK